MSIQTSNLYLIQDLDDPGRTAGLSSADLDAMRSVASWIHGFVARPNADLGRAGPICPFVTGSEDRRTLWLAPEHLNGRSGADVARLVSDYKAAILDAEPMVPDDAIYKSILMVFTDASADQANDLMEAAGVTAMKQPSYRDDGVVLGEFHERSDGTAVYNDNFHPFRSPVPFLLIRLAADTDWKFFLNDDQWLSIWAHRFGENAVKALASELRRSNWRQID